MGYSGIGGQAVMEGVMMKNGIHYAVAVRKPDKEIVVDAREYPGIVKNQKIKKYRSCVVSSILSIRWYWACGH